MHNEERERRDNRPNSARQVTARGPPSSQAAGVRSDDHRLASSPATQSAAMQSSSAAAAAAVKKKPVHLNREYALRLQLNVSDADEVFVKLLLSSLSSIC